MCHVRILDAVAELNNRVADAERRWSRPPGSVSLIAVSKTRSIEAIRSAIAAGLRCFGENYAQEGVAKIKRLRREPLEWHFIGALQANKCRDIARHFQWVHTVDRLKTLRRLNGLRPDGLPPLNICLQVNISGETSKAGLPPVIGALRDVAGACMESPGLRFRGLMALPMPTSDLAAQRSSFRKLGELFAMLKCDHPDIDTLSMGSSGDMEAAIAEGATILRIGTAIFGERKRRPILSGRSKMPGMPA